MLARARPSGEDVGMSASPSRVLWAVCAVALISTIGMALPYPILAPIFMDGPADGFTRWAGLSPQLLMGAALAVNPLGILVGNLFIGPLSDRLGRKPVLMRTLSITLVGHLITAWALLEREYLLFVLARFVTGLTESNTAVARAVIADHPELDRVRSFATLNATQYSGWLLGPLMGGIFLKWGDTWPFIVAALVMLPGLWLVSTALDSPADTQPHVQAPDPAQAAQAASKGRTTLGLLLEDGLIARVFACQAVYTLGITAYYEYYPLWLVERVQLGGFGIGVVTALQCALMTAASLTCHRWLPATQGAKGALRRSALVALLTGLLLSSLSLALPWAGVGVVVALGLPLALYNAVLPPWLSERFAHHVQGKVMGLLSTIFCLSNVLSAVWGSLVSLNDVGMVMLVAGGCCAVAAWGLRGLSVRPGTEAPSDPPA